MAQNPPLARAASATKMGVAWPSRPRLYLQLLAGFLRNSIQHLLNRVALTGSQIKGAACSALNKPSHTRDMRVGKIRDMDVVPDGGAVRRGVAVSIYPKVGNMTVKRHHRTWN